MTNMASRRQSESRNGSSSSSEATSRTPTEQTVELPRIVPRKIHQGSPWTINNPAVRQLSSLFRARSAPKYYPLGLWHQQKEPEFPNIRNSCLITASQRHGSRSSGHLAQSADKTETNKRNESDAGQGRVESLPPLYPNQSREMKVDHENRNHQTPDLLASNEKHLHEVDHTPITREKIAREVSFADDNTFHGDKVSPGSIRNISDPQTSASTQNTIRRQPPPLVRRKKVEITEDMLPGLQNKTETLDDRPGKQQSDVNDSLNTGGSEETVNHDVMNDDTSVLNVRDDKTSVTGRSRDINHTEEYSVGESTSENSYPEEQYPPINTIYICLILGKEADAQMKSDIRQTLSTCRLQLLNKGYDLEIKTFDILHLSNLDPHVRQDIVYQYLEQCQSHGLGPFYYAMLGDDEEDKEPPLTLDYDIYEQLTKESSKADGDLLGDWYKLDESVNPPVYRIKYVHDVIENYKILSTGEKTDIWNQTKQQLANVLDTLQTHINSASDKLVEGIVLSRSVQSIVMQTVEQILQTLPDKEFLKSSRKTTVADLLQNPGDPSSKARDVDTALSRHFNHFFEEVIKNIKIINKRRTTDFEKSPVILCERWSHWRKISRVLPESIAERFTTLMKQIQELLLDPNNSLPIVVKSDDPEMCFSLLSLLQQAVIEWVVPTPAVIVQFAGLTERTSRSDCFLETIFNEVSATYGYSTQFVNTRDIVQGAKTFKTLLNKVSKRDGPEQPLVLLLGAVNLSIDCNSWLPQELPSNVYIIVTALPDSYSSMNDQSQRVGVKLLQMEAVLDDNKLEQLDHITNDIDKTETLLGGADIVRDVLCLLVAHNNGITEWDIADALTNVKAEYTSELVSMELLHVSLACVKSLLSSWIHSVYDSGKLLYKIPNKYHSRIIDRYVKQDTGNDAAATNLLSSYQETAVKVYVKQLEFNKQLCLAAPERDGLAVLLKWRLLTFTRCLARWPSSEINLDILRDTIFSFYWLSPSFQFLSVSDVTRIIWQLREKSNEIKTVCLLLESYLADVTEVDVIASGILACLDRKSTSSLLSHLYDTTKEWLMKRGASLIPCHPVIEMPRIAYVSIPGAMIVLKVLNAKLLLTYGLDNGLQVWDVETTNCLHQTSTTTQATLHDIKVNVHTMVAYYTEETLLIGWNIADGTRVLELDLLPHVSETGRKFSPQKDDRPFLTVADVSKDGRLVAIRINHREMLADNKGVIVVSVKDGAAEILGAVGDGFFTSDHTNICFCEDGTILTITQKLHYGRNTSRIIFIHCDPSNGELYTVSKVRDQSQDTDIGSHLNQEQKEELDKAGVDDNPVEQMPAFDPIGKDNRASDTEEKTEKPKTETQSSEENEKIVEDGRSPDQEQRSDSGQYAYVTENGEEETSQGHLDGNITIDMREAEYTALDAAATSNEETEQIQQEDSVNNKTGYEMKERFKRQEALDAADEDTDIWKVLTNQRLSDDVDSGLSTVNYVFEAGVIARCLGDSLAVGYLPNGVAILVPKDGLLRTYIDLRNAGLYKIVGLACLGDGRIVSAHSQGHDKSPLMLSVGSPQPNRLYLEHRGFFRSIERAPEVNSVMVLYHNKIVIMDVDLPACTHVLDFPVTKVYNAICWGDVLYVGTGQSIVTRKLSEYTVPPPYDVISSGADSPMLEDGEEMETIRVIAVPSAALPPAMTSYGPGGVSHAVLLPGGQKIVVGVAGKLKLMNINDGSLQEMKQESHTPLLDLFLVGSKARSLVALENDVTSAGMNILKWELDSISEPPKVVNCGIIQGKWRLSSNRSVLVSLNRRRDTDTADVCIVNLEDLSDDNDRHYSINVTNRSLNFAISDSGRYLAAWENRANTVTIWNVAKGYRIQTTRASEEVNQQDAADMELVPTDDDKMGNAGNKLEDNGKEELETGEKNSISNHLEGHGNRERLGQENSPGKQEHEDNRDNPEKKHDMKGTRHEDALTDREQHNTGAELEQQANTDDLKHGLRQGDNADNLESGSTADYTEQENTEKNQALHHTTDNLKTLNYTDEMEEGNTGDDLEPNNTADKFEQKNTAEVEKEQITQSVIEEENNEKLATESGRGSNRADIGEELEYETLNNKEIPIRVHSQTVIIVGDMIVVGSTDGYLYQMDLDHLFGIQDNSAELADYLMQSRTILAKEPAKALYLLGDDNMLISIGTKEYITLLDLSYPKEQVIFDRCESKVTHTALSGDHTWLLVSYANETIRLWNARTGQVQCTVPIQTTIHWLSFAQQDNTVLAWVEKYEGKRSRIIKFDLNR